MCADDLPERSIARAKAIRSAELAQVESPVGFQRKRGLPAALLTQAGQVSAVVL